jgi:hypothetical protein
MATADDPLVAVVVSAGGQACGSGSKIVQPVGERWKVSPEEAGQAE